MQTSFSPPPSPCPLQVNAKAWPWLSRSWLLRQPFPNTRMLMHNLADGSVLPPADRRLKGRRRRSSAYQLTGDPPQGRRPEPRGVCSHCICAVLRGAGERLHGCAGNGGMGRGGEADPRRAWGEDGPPAARWVAASSDGALTRCRGSALSQLSAPVCSVLLMVGGGGCGVRACAEFGVLEQIIVPRNEVWTRGKQNRRIWRKGKSAGNEKAESGGGRSRGGTEEREGGGWAIQGGGRDSGKRGFCKRKVTVRF